VPNDFAWMTALMEATRARSWRSVGDTAVAAQLLYGDTGWTSRTRSVDFYPEGALFWLEVDATIRRLTKGQKSLDDFCKAFYGIKDGVVGVVTYELDDVYAALSAVAPYDWRALAKKRIYATAPAAPLDGITAAGYKLGWRAEETAALKADQAIFKYLDQRWTLGLAIAADGTLLDVFPNTPADRAGFAPGMKLVAVGGRAFDEHRLRDFVVATKSKPGLELIATSGDFYRVARLDVKTGARYPILERVAGTPDLLAAILAPRVK
jgi:predicted metalloprotease with PDZ domain